MPDARFIVVFQHLDHIAAETLPSRLQGHHATADELQVGMVGSRGATLRTIIQHGEGSGALSQSQHFAIHRQDALGLVLQGGQREVDRQYGEGIDQQLVLAVHHATHLLLRTMLATEEARALADALGINPGSRRTDAGRIPLHRQRDVLCRKLTNLDTIQFTIALTHSIPRLQLTLEETPQGTILSYITVQLMQLLTGVQFHGSQAILIQVVGIDLVDRQGCIAVASPAAAEIQFSKDAAYAVAARKP